MRNKLWMGFIGLALSAAMTISASAAILEEEKCSCGGLIYWGIDWDDQQSNHFYAGPNYHATLYGAYGVCQECGHGYYGTMTVYDYHDYELNGNTLICTGCGDSYQYTR